ncbi:MAG: response regulator [Limnohabitans sp.]|nr:response regulator [Limnohabitans sp.]
MKKNIFIFLLIPFFLYSQTDDFIPFKNEGYNSIFKESVKLITSKNNKSYFNAIEAIEKLEKEILDSKKIDHINAYYFNLATIFYYQKDYLKTNKYLDKAIHIAHKNKIFKCLGREYELKFLINYENNTNRAKYLFKSKYYLEHYNPIFERKDLYYNLSRFYFDLKDYPNVLINAIKSKEIRIKYFNSYDNKMTDILIMYAYVHTNQIQKAKKLLNEVENRSFAKQIKFNEFNKVKAHLYNIKSLIAIKENNNDIAIANLIVSDSFRTIDNNSQIKQIFQNYNLENERNKLNYQLDILKSKLKFSQKEVEYQKSIRIFLFVILFFLIVVVVIGAKFYLYKIDRNKTLEEKNNQLANALSIKNKLFDSISHELRTPLNIMKGDIYLFKKNINYNTELKNESISVIERAVNQLIMLTKNIIDYNEIENNSIIVNKVAFDVRESIEKIVESTRNLRQNNNSITLNINKNFHSQIYTDKYRFEQILHCVIDNALKYTENGLVLIQIESKTLNSDKEKITIIVEDSGIGIPKESLISVFDMFNQGSNEMYLRYGGNGLGLGLAKKSIELLEGTIDIQSEVGRGTRVIIEFETEYIVNFEKSEKIEIDSKKKSDNKFILVVEDNKLNQIITKKIVNSKGFDCEIAENGLVAIEMIKKRDYCLVFMDIMMPIMDGFEATKYIKELKPDLPVIALTSISENIHIDKFRQVGITKVLNKPINLDELFEILTIYCI